MELQQIKESFELLKIANNHSYVLIPELSKELKTTKTHLMGFVINNPKNFYTENIWSVKDVKVRRRLWPNDPKSVYTTTEQVKNRNLGLGIKNVYLDAAENYRTDEWLQKIIKEKGKYLHISESDNYGYIQGYYVKTDLKKQDDEFRYYLWRNTQTKINWLKEEGYLSSGTFYYGGFGDSYGNKHDNIITLGKINELKGLGWSFNNFKPLS